MARIFEFPAKPVEEWRAVERGMREVLKAAAASPEMIDTVCLRMRPVFEQLRFGYASKLNLPLPASTTAQEKQALYDAVNEVFTDLERQMREFSHRALLERLKTEVELYVARHRGA